MIEIRYGFEECAGPHRSPWNEELGRVVLSAQISDDGHEQTFGKADGGGCVVGMFGRAIIR